MSWKEPLKQRLWAAIDELGEADGFTLTATRDDIVFTTLTAAGWDEHVLELEPLDAAVARRELKQAWERIGAAEKRAKELGEEIAVKEARLVDIDAALANALGKGNA